MAVFEKLKICGNVIKRDSGAVGQRLSVGEGKPCLVSSRISMALAKACLVGGRVDILGRYMVREDLVRVRVSKDYGSVVLAVMSR